jgi:hypothetical protein
MMAAAGVVLLDREADSRSGLAEFAAHLAVVMNDIARGVEPNEAFGWSGSRRHRSFHGESWDQLKKMYEVASTVRNLATALRGKRHAESVEYVASLYACSASQAESALVSTGDSGRPAGKERALGLALDAVSTFGACGHRVSRDTAAEYYKELGRNGDFLPGSPP